MFTHARVSWILVLPQYEKNVQNKATVAMSLPKSLEMKVADAKYAALSHCHPPFLCLWRLLVSAEGCDGTRYRSLMDKCSRRGGVFHQCDANFLNSMLVKLRVSNPPPAPRTQ